MRLPKLLATAKPWNVERAVEELGDAIFSYDDKVVLEVDEKYPLIYVFTVLETGRVFKLVLKEPPAYVERVVPVEAVYTAGFEEVVNSVVGAVVERGLRQVYGEVKPRGYFIGMKEKEASARLSRALREAGVFFSRRARLSVKLEDTRYGIAFALIERGADRVAYWRRRRLGVTI